ncbi:hypothetical protein TUM18999_11910 [Pseudomonas tohonis]|uniref:Type 4 fimbrial biogenesis protein PilX N-terminal domain-containing protein n=1 Tax=Pseudomonas tohonis TaxID=2725477 RepID=A0A6J4DZX1_9PSED|nr:PilX N-terminal domain-containing pilus assembly protein [Pseudomonas tohonis]BCG23000.1 hypothetical protein TUM18999_11910 [Pseudomonas tohonis]GJN53313.1 hypothetical protein TUM20286_30650 [Pseudomonas tohonis]
MQSLRPLQRQAGATLIVALVFLVVLTAAGITAVRFATNDERMASSNQFRNTAYQQGQTEIRSQLLRLNVVANRQPLMSATSGTLATTSNEDDPNWVGSLSRFPSLMRPISLASIVALPASGNSENAQTNTIRSVGQLDCASFGKGYSFGNYTCQQYEIKATTRIGGALSDQAQGLVFFNLK